MNLIQKVEESKQKIRQLEAVYEQVKADIKTLKGNLRQYENLLLKAKQLEDGISDKSTH